MLGLRFSINVKDVLCSLYESAFIIRCCISTFKCWLFTLSVILVSFLCIYLFVWFFLFSFLVNVFDICVHDCCLSM